MAPVATGVSCRTLSHPPSRKTWISLLGSVIPEMTEVTSGVSAPSWRSKYKSPLIGLFSKGLKGRVKSPDVVVSHAMTTVGFRTIWHFRLAWAR